MEPTLNDRIFIGTVETYNSRKGYGFIKKIGERSYPSEDSSEDLIVETPEDERTTYFVHHSAIDTSQTFPVKKLYTGEYVEFDICKRSEDSDDICCQSVRGILGGKLLCDHGKFTFRKLNWSSKKRSRGEDNDYRQPTEVPLPEKADGEVDDVCEYDWAQ